MTIENVSCSIAEKVSDRAWIRLATLDLQSDSHLLPDTLLTVLRGLVKKQYGPYSYSVWSGSRLFAYAQYQLTNWQIRLFCLNAIWKMIYALSLDQRLKKYVDLK